VQFIKVKCSLADWNADQHNDKRKEGGWCEEQRANLCEFECRVPSEIVTRVPDWVPPEVGLIELSWFHGSYARVRAEIRRPAKRCSKHKLSYEEWQGICRHLCYHHSNAHFARHFEMLRKQDEQAATA
jgi:hypothetical protein